jgi:chorismate dehydratase
MRLGVVPYLNALPLVADLPPGTSVRAGVPSMLSAWLEEGVVDAALLPVAEAFRGVGGDFVGTRGIACDGAVESVLAFVPAGAPPPWPSDVVLDPASRTSAALLRVLLERRHGLRPRYATAAEPGPDPRARPAAATLVIGDRAFERRRGWGGGVVDLGEAWKAWTGLPFVFARWTARRGLSPAAHTAIEGAVEASARTGVARAEALGRRHGPAHGVEPEDAARYLARTLRYDVDGRAEEGLARFREEALRLEGAAA